MAPVIIPPPAKLFIGVLFHNSEYLGQALQQFVEAYGEIDITSEDIPFTHTEYYKEIGGTIYKKLVSFKNLIDRDTLADIKIYTNTVEFSFTSNNRRPVNIDPGYLTLSNVFLASCKEYFHRSYIGKGIFVENEYYYTKGKYTFWEWTYPDYKKKEYLEFFHTVRKKYHAQLKEADLL